MNQLVLLVSENKMKDRLSFFCEEKELVVLNTFFKLNPRRLYTWTSPRDNVGQIVRNQIDYILINKRFRNSCTYVKTYPRANIASDHNPLVAVLKLNSKNQPSIKHFQKADGYAYKNQSAK